MKYSKRILVFVIPSFFVFQGCDKKEVIDTVADYGTFTVTDKKVGEKNYKVVEGRITINFSFTKDEAWILDGGVFVDNGATLTIEPGTKIYGAFNEKTAFLSVQRGSKINADGTADAPIVLTTIRAVTSIPQPGDWGGIIINGNAPINVSGGEKEGEGGTGKYGGTDPLDNSGTLRYVIVEYGGKLLGPTNELNNISLNGVGAGTIIEFVEALYGDDDGVEIFGGTVNIKYIVSMGNADDCIDWSFGWSGMGQFWVANQDPFAGDRGIEADNNENDYLALPFSKPIVSNITIVGAEDGDGTNVGIMLRHGTQGEIYNALITNFAKYGIEAKDSSISFAASADLIIKNSIVFNNGFGGTSNFKNADTFENDATNSQSAGIVLLNDYEGVVSAGALDPTTLNVWFSSANYIGAVDAANNWTNGWIHPLR